jgi:hypothetical protein
MQSQDSVESNPVVEIILQTAEKMLEQVNLCVEAPDYRAMVAGLAGLLKAATRCTLRDQGVPSKHREELVVSRVYASLRNSGIGGPEAELYSGFRGMSEEDVAVRSLAPGEDVQLPTIRVREPVREQDEARAYTELLAWLVEAPRPFYTKVDDGVEIRIEPLPSDPTIMQVGWYGNHGKIISVLQFDTRFAPRQFRI